MWFGYVPQIKNTNVISARGLLLLRKPDPPNSVHTLSPLPSTIIPCQPKPSFPVFEDIYIYIYISSFPRVFHICICASLCTFLIYTYRYVHKYRRHLINFYFRARKARRKEARDGSRGGGGGGEGEKEEVKVGVRKEGGRNVLEREGAYVLSSCR